MTGERDRGGCGTNRHIEAGGIAQPRDRHETKREAKTLTGKKTWRGSDKGCQASAGRKVCGFTARGKRCAQSRAEVENRWRKTTAVKKIAGGTLRRGQTSAYNRKICPGGVKIR